MKVCVLVAFVTLLAAVAGMPPISSEYSTRCRCLQLESRIIPPGRLRSIEVIAKGPHCPEREVIAGLASGAKVCLDPRSAWVTKLAEFVLDKQAGRRQRAISKARA